MGVSKTLALSTVIFDEAYSSEASSKVHETISDHCSGRVNCLPIGFTRECQYSRLPVAKGCGQQSAGNLNSPYYSTRLVLCLIAEVLIRWENGLSVDTTWELTSVINDQFPKFHLEDKVALWGAGNDMPRITKVYVRKCVRKGGQHV